MAALIVALSVNSVLSNPFKPMNLHSNSAISLIIYRINSRLQPFMDCKGLLLNYFYL